MTDPEALAITVGSIVQLRPDTCRNQMFAACLMIVTEPKPWGAQGFVPALGENGERGGSAYYRAKWDEMDLTGGIAPWMPGGRCVA